MRINRWLFKDFKENIQNYNYIKTIEFCTFSDLKNPNYELIGKVLDKMSYNKDIFISIGNTKAPFGVTINPQNNKEMNNLLNSCRFSFVLTKDILETKYLIRSVLAGIYPICNLNHVFVKQLGLLKYATLPDEENILYQIGEILDKKHIFHYDIYHKGYKYFKLINRWNTVQRGKL